jgi:hypothetical protein
MSIFTTQKQDFKNKSLSALNSFNKIVLDLQSINEKIKDKIQDLNFQKIDIINEIKEISEINSQNDRIIDNINKILK